MANRAYLYSVDSDGYTDPANWERSIRDKLPYYDSRWNIPYAWFFLFRSADVKMIDVYSRVYSRTDASSEDSHWQEVKFFAPKATALRTFAERRPLLLEIAVSPFSSEALFDHFTETIAQRPGNCLIMDPSEVFDGFIPETDEENFAHCKNILERLEVEKARAEGVMAAIGYHSNFAAEDGMSFRMNTIGTTYA